MLQSVWIIVCVILLLDYVHCKSSRHDWGYRQGNFSAPSTWKDRYRSCGGRRQSPINIDVGDTEYWPCLKSVTITEHPMELDVTIAKTPTSVQMMFSDKWLMSFSGQGCYKPMSIHWHWGAQDQWGSEHTIDDIKYPMEAHIITYNCDLYNNVKDASVSPSGLYAFGVLYKIGKRNAAIGELTKYINEMNKSGSMEIPEISLTRWLPEDLTRYYRYEGSLTTPPCTENVMWTVYEDVQTISPAQLNFFRSLQYGTPESGAMVDNFRPVIPISCSSDSVKRIVYRSFKY